MAIAGDLRDSSPRMMRAIARAIEDSGLKVDNCGFIPSPALFYYAMLKGIASIMITGSHIPDDRNGIKFSRRIGEIAKDDEAGIYAGILEVRKEVYGMSAQESLFDENDMFKTTKPLGKINLEAERLYVKRYFDIFPSNCLSGKRIVVDQASAVARDILVGILKALGAEVISVGRTDKFSPRDTEDVMPELLAYFKDLAEKYNHPFAILSMDGDSDRPFVIDENGKFYRGDILGLVVAKYLKVDFAVYPDTCNDALDIALKEEKTTVKHTPVGAPGVIKAMNDAIAEKYSRVVGWEPNGGFLLGSDFMINGKILKALPTRDAVLPILAVLLQAIIRNMINM